MKKLWFGIVQDAKEMVLDSISISFELERFAMCIASDRK